MKSFELDAQIRSFGLSKKQFALLMGVHYQTVFGWLTNRSQISDQARSFLAVLEEEFDKALEFSYRFLISSCNEGRKRYDLTINIPLFETLEGHIRYGTMDKSPIYPIELYQTLAFSVARAWRLKNAKAQVVGVDIKEYESWCRAGKKDHYLDKHLVEWMASEGLEAQQPLSGSDINGIHL